MKHPKITVLMPVYNEEKFLREAIESILHQTFGDFELILLDDGSIDGSPAILAEYAHQDPRVSLVKNETNQGLIQTLNHGLEIANGEYIARMDADDISLPERFDRQVAYMDQHPEVGVLGTNIAQIDEKGRLMNRGRPLDSRPISPTVISWMMLWRCAIYHPTVMIRRSVLRQTGFAYNPRFRHAEDYDLWTRLNKHTVIASLPEVLVYYRVHTNNISVLFKKEQKEKAQAIIRRQLTALLENPPSESALRTWFAALEGHCLKENSDYAGAADLLFQAYQHFCQRPLPPLDRRQIEESLIYFILILGRAAALHSFRDMFQVLRRLRGLPLKTLISGLALRVWPGSA